MKVSKSLFILILCITSVSYSQDSISSYQLQKDIFKDIESSKLFHIQKLIDSVGIAAPIPNEVLAKHVALVSSYNPVHRIPNYVVHVILKDILYGSQTRSNDFRPDPFIKQNMSDSTDYWNSGYDRGHMAASADFKWNRKALSESYFYSNIIPQNPQLNQNTWNKLEMQVREWAIDNSELIVVTGPVLKENLPKIPQGSFKVSIPEYIYKIVLDYYPPSYKAIAFLYPNKDVPYELEKHVVSIDSIEQLTGIDFFSKLEDSLENIVEAENSLTEFDAHYFEQLKASQFTPKDFGKGKINSLQARDYIGKEACVCGKVVSTKFSENGKTNPTYINLDKKYPEQVFTLMIFGQDRQNFSYKPEEFLQGKTICVKGKVGEYKGTPQIIANKEKQVEVIGN
ncbi:MAG: DNA/RNA non-specific endonuclease [Chitinophagales bacterium]|nr:DNA/RNA non-specific endonuclease [Chitinophagales bacterium]